jgi:hypothetical protein
MSFKKWEEYFNARGTVVAKPEIVAVPDYTGPNDKSPEAAVTNNLGMKIPKSKGKLANYRTSEKPVIPPVEKDGLVYDGKKATKYPDPKLNKTAETKKVSNQWPNKKSNEKSAKIAAKAGVKTWPKTKTEQFIDATETMSISEFTAYMLKECGMGLGMDEGGETLPMVTAYATGKFHPHPPEAIKYVVALAKANPRIMDSLIHEIKRSGAMSDMLDSSMDHPETFDHLTDLFGDEEEGPQRSRSLARSMDDKVAKFQDEHDGMHENVAPPFGGFDDDEDDSNMDVHKNHHPDDMDDDDSPDKSNDDIDDSDAPTSDDPQDDKAGDEPDQKDKSEEKPHRVKKKFAHDHLLGAMSEYPHMRDKMKDYAS